MGSQDVGAQKAVAGFDPGALTQKSATAHDAKRGAKVDTPPQPEEKIKVETTEDFWKVQIEAIYRRRNPHKLLDVPKLLEKHKGKEVMLYKKVCQRYDLNSAKLYADPKSWEGEDNDVKDDDGDTSAARVAAAPATLLSSPVDGGRALTFGVSGTGGPVSATNDAAASPGTGSGPFGTSTLAPATSDAHAENLFGTSTIFGSPTGLGANITAAASLFGKSEGSALFGDSSAVGTGGGAKINLFVGGTEATARFSSAPANASSPKFAIGGATSLFGFSSASSLSGQSALGGVSVFGTAAPGDQGMGNSENVRSSFAADKPFIFGTGATAPAASPSNVGGTTSIFGGSGASPPSSLFSTSSLGASLAGGALFFSTAGQTCAPSKQSSCGEGGMTIAAPKALKVGGGAHATGGEESARPGKRLKGEDVERHALEESAQGALDSVEHHAPLKAAPEVLARRKILRARRTRNSGAETQDVASEVVDSSPEFPKACGLAGTSGKQVVTREEAQGAASGLCSDLLARPGVTSKDVAPSVAATSAASTGTRGGQAKSEAPKEMDGTTADSGRSGGEVDTSQERPSKVESSEDFWKVQVEAIYRRRNPYKLGDVGGLMEKYKGKELELYVKVCKRYDLDPKKLYADESAWADEDKDVKDEDGDAGMGARTGPGGLLNGGAHLPAESRGSGIGDDIANMSGFSKSSNASGSVLNAAPAPTLFGGSSGSIFSMFPAGRTASIQPGDLFGVATAKVAPSGGEAAMRFASSAGSSSLFGRLSGFEASGQTTSGPAAKGSSGGLFGVPPSTGGASGEFVFGGATNGASSARRLGGIFGVSPMSDASPGTLGIPAATGTSVGLFGMSTSNLAFGSGNIFDLSSARIAPGSMSNTSPSTGASNSLPGNSPTNGATRSIFGTSASSGVSGGIFGSLAAASPMAMGMSGNLFGGASSGGGSIFGSSHGFGTGGPTFGIGSQGLFGSPPDQGAAAFGVAGFGTSGGGGSASKKRRAPDDPGDGPMGGRRRGM